MIITLSGVAGPHQCDPHALFDRHDTRLLKSGSRSQNIRRFTYPVGNTLSKKEVKKIAKNEKKLANTKLIREDKVEDPFTGSHLVDHYVAEEHNFKIDYQKEMLCAGQPFRVLFLILKMAKLICGKKKKIYNFSSMFLNPDIFFQIIE